MQGDAAVIPARLTVVTLGARDVPALRRFYVGLGWSEVDGSDDGWAAFLLGGVVLALFPEEALHAEAASAATGRGGFTLAMNVDQKADVDSTFAEVVQAGARPLAEPQDRPWGVAVMRMWRIPKETGGRSRGRPAPSSVSAARCSGSDLEA